MFRNGFLGILAAAGAAMMSAMPNASAPQVPHLGAGLPAEAATPRPPKRVRTDSRRGPSRRSHKTGPGWSHAQVQRMARKRKNKQTNKARHR